MKKTLHTYFIPHEGNNYHPHILHTKRAVFYSTLFAVMKCIVFIFALSIPSTVFVMPDILTMQEREIVRLVNEVREENGVDPLTSVTALRTSSLLKAQNISDTGEFAHVTSDGKGLAYFLGQAGYRYSTAGENLAMGFSDASELVKAWVQSPTHFNNLIDPDFQETGAGIVSGLYGELPTVYVAEHFGKPKEQVIAAAVQPVTVAPVPAVVEGEKIETEETPIPTDPVPVQPAQPVSEPQTPVTTQPDEAVPVQGQPTAQNNVPDQVPDAPAMYAKDTSLLRWEKDGKGIVLSATAYISAPQGSTVEVTVKETSFALHETTPGVYTGSVETTYSEQELFDVVLPASLTVKAGNTVLLRDTLNWVSPTIVAPTPIEKYTMAKKQLSPITGIFDYVQYLYLGFIIFFAIALILSIVIEIRKQHPHIIFQTVSLLGLLVVFYIF